MGQAAGEGVLNDAVAAFVSALGDHLIAAFALGSLAHGGFSEPVSDVDIGLVLTDESRHSEVRKIQSVAKDVRGRGTELHKRLSVFWATESTLREGTDGGRFPPLDRLDLIEYGRLLVGNDPREGMVRPSRIDLLVGGAEFALDFLSGEKKIRALVPARVGSILSRDPSVTQQMHNPGMLVDQGPRRLTKLVLFPVRFLFTAETAQVGTNALAVEHCLADPRIPAKELIKAAMGWRQIAPQHVADAIRLLDEGLIPLYCYFIEDHRQRLSSIGRRDLAKRYERWRARLLA